MDIDVSHRKMRGIAKKSVGKLASVWTQENYGFILPVNFYTFVSVQFLLAVGLGGGLGVP